jgi:probable rRNA maturation factor
MTLEVEVQQAAGVADLPSSARFEAWARAAWQGGDERADLVIRVADEDESRQLNRDYRGIDKPTNVLSFAFERLPEIDFFHVGDIVICAPVVAREAGEQGKPLEAHWAHMVVHGVLHLQGYDHVEPDAAQTMEALETRILTQLGYPAPYHDDES